MYEYIRGTLRGARPDRAVVETDGLAYRIAIALSTFSKLPTMGSEVKLFLSHVVREDAELLYGFLYERERDFFEKLITISGVGPKTALCLIGHMEPQELQRAISSENISLICKVPGIGKKTAERLVIELRDGFKVLDCEEVMRSNVEGDALSALIRLGYPEARAQKAVGIVVKTTQEELTLSQLITLALRQI